MVAGSISGSNEENDDNGDNQKLKDGKKLAQQVGLAVPLEGAHDQLPITRGAALVGQGTKRLYAAPTLIKVPATGRFRWSLQ
jgi:hypothetical protein